MWSGDIYYKGLSTGSIPALGFVWGKNSGVPRRIPFKEKFSQMEIELSWVFFFFFFLLIKKLIRVGCKNAGNTEKYEQKARTFTRRSNFCYLGVLPFQRFLPGMHTYKFTFSFSTRPPTMLSLIISHLLYSSLQLLRSRAPVVTWLTWRTHSS